MWLYTIKPSTFDKYFFPFWYDKFVNKIQLGYSAIRRILLDFNFNEKPNS